MFNEFKNSINRKIEVNNFYPTFFKFAKSKIPLSEYNKLKNNQFFVCGYINNKPAIYYYYKNERDSILSIGYKTNYIKDDKLTIIKEFLKKNTIEKTLLFVQSALNNIIEERNKNSVSPVGGALSLVYIQNNNIYWVNGRGFEGYNCMNDFLEAFYKDEVNMWYRSAEDSVIMHNDYKNFYH